MANFPRSARTGQTHKKFGRRFIYSETTESWTPISTLASVAEVRTAEQAVSASNTTTYQTAVELPLSGNTAGAMAFVVETNRLYLWSGTGWYNIATIAGASSSISGANSSYTLATDGTPTVVTLSQSGLTSPTWSYEVTTGSLGRTATVTQVNNVFTITPSTLAKNVGSFGLTFKATDGSNTIVTSSQFTMSNTAPVIGTGPSATYTLASDGTPTVITLAATDADGHAITWSYEVVSGSLGSTTVTNVGSVFTITPSTDENDAGTFQLRFVASDGAASDTDVAEFTLAFGPDWSNATLAYTVSSIPIIFGGGSATVSGNYVAVGSGKVNASGDVCIVDLTTGTIVRTLSHDGSPEYGQALSMSGDYLVVGSPRYGGGVGRAYIYNVTNGQLIHTLVNPNAAAASSDNFGDDVCISGNYVIVGAWHTDDPASDSGKAYIYNATTGALVYTLNNPNAYSTGSADWFGNAVSIDGNYAIVGAHGEDEAGLGFGAAGKAYIFSTSSGNWTDAVLVATLNDPNTYGTGDVDVFGFSVAIDGNYAIIGANYEDDAPGDNLGGNTSGKAYIFSTSSGDWTDASLLHTLDNPNPYGTNTNDYFGTWVEISGTNCMVGAVVDSVQGGSSVLTAYIFDVVTGTLLYTAASTHGANSLDSQNQLAISDQYAVIGNGFATGGSTGTIYVYQAG